MCIVLEVLRLIDQTKISTSKMHLIGKNVCINMMWQLNKVPFSEWLYQVSWVEAYDAMILFLELVTSATTATTPPPTTAIATARARAKQEEDITNFKTLTHSLKGFYRQKHPTKNCVLNYQMNSCYCDVDYQILIYFFMISGKMIDNNILNKLLRMKKFGFFSI